MEDIHTNSTLKNERWLEIIDSANRGLINSVVSNKSKDYYDNKSIIISHVTAINHYTNARQCLNTDNYAADAEWLLEMSQNNDSIIKIDKYLKNLEEEIKSIKRIFNDQYLNIDSIEECFEVLQKLIINQSLKQEIIQHLVNKIIDINILNQTIEQNFKTLEVIHHILVKCEEFENLKAQLKPIITKVIESITGQMEDQLYVKRTLITPKWLDQCCIKLIQLDKQNFDLQKRLTNLCMKIMDERTFFTIKDELANSQPYLGMLERICNTLNSVETKARKVDAFIRDDYLSVLNSVKKELSMKIIKQLEDELSSQKTLTSPARLKECNNTLDALISIVWLNEYKDKLDVLAKTNELDCNLKEMLKKDKTVDILNDDSYEKLINLKKMITAARKIIEIENKTIEIENKLNLATIPESKDLDISKNEKYNNT